MRGDFLLILCPLAIAFGLTGVAWAQSQPAAETYDFSISKGLLEFSRGHYEAARTLFERAAQAQPDDVDALDYLGQTLLRLKEYEKAEATFRHLLSVQPDSERALLWLGVAQASLGKYREAQANLDAAAKANPDNPLVYYYQGLVAQQLKAYDQSPALFSRALALSPDLTPSARYFTGVAHYERGLLDQAQKEFEAAIAAGDPESELARSAREFLDQQRNVPGKPRPWDLSASISEQYDTNVVLLPSGTTPPGGGTGISQKDDFRTTFYLRGEYRAIQTADWTAGATYGFYQSLHAKLHDFNVQDHSPTAFVQRQMGPVSLRLQYVYDNVSVGGDPYLVSQAIQPLVTIAEEGNRFTQFQFRYQNKEFQDDRFPTNSTRNGKNWLAGFTQFFYFDDGTSNVRFGYTYDTDRTGGGSPAFATPGVQTNADWAYHGHRLSAGVSLQPVWTLRPSLAFDYYLQNYDNPNSFSPTGTTVRRDRDIFFTASLGKELSKIWSVSVEYNYVRDQSNVSAFDYVRNIFSVSLTGRF
jgi:tetratricopeptide (TPR) repeat protein